MDASDEGDGLKEAVLVSSSSSIDWDSKAYSSSITASVSALRLLLLSNPPLLSGKPSSPNMEALLFSPWEGVLDLTATGRAPLALTLTGAGGAVLEVPLRWRDCWSMGVRS